MSFSHEYSSYRPKLSKKNKHVEKRHRFKRHINPPLVELQTKEETPRFCHKEVINHIKREGQKKGKKYKILSIDGGGIRGIIPCMVLLYLEKQLGKPLCKVFDFIVGTSTGGIIAIGLTTPNSKKEPKFNVSDLLQIYTTKAKTVFQERDFLGTSVFEAKYKSSGIDSVLEEFFGETRLSDQIGDFMVSSFNSKTKETNFYDKLGCVQMEDYYTKDVARATSAAPTYFPAKLGRSRTL